MDTQKCLFVLGNMASVVASSGPQLPVETTQGNLFGGMSQDLKSYVMEEEMICGNAIFAIKQGKTHSLNQREFYWE
ncbi:unnamed protein product [Ilex paraguariensis]|uniref:Uncharacterized protein n=1 Tax=Ilex paraguariensis TaxID=185542 RepID=A0ABC8SFW2_9AQUA